MSATKRGAATNYPTMSVQEICDLYQSSQVQHVANGRRGNYKIKPGLLAGHPIADDAICCLWVTKDVLLEGIGQRVMLAWGYTPKQIVPWIKGRIVVEPGLEDFVDNDEGGGLRPGGWKGRMVLQKGMGRIFRNVVEYLLVGARGKYSQLVLDKGVDGLIFSEEVILAARGRHSAKPEIVYSMIERMFPGPYLELFARNTRPGWTSWGNQLIASTSPEGTACSIQTDLNGEQQIMLWDPSGQEHQVPIISRDREHLGGGIYRYDVPAEPHPEPPIEWP